MLFIGIGVAIGFVIGFIFTLVLFYDMTPRVLDELEDHKDELIMIVCVLLYVGGALSLIPTNPELFIDAGIPELLIAAGAGMGLSKAGRGAKGYLDKKQKRE